MTLTGINVFPLWSYDVSTVTPNRITNSSKKGCRFWNPGIRTSELLRLRNLSILQIKVFFKKQRTFEEMDKTAHLGQDDAETSTDPLNSRGTDKHLVRPWSVVSGAWVEVSAIKGTISDFGDTSSHEVVEIEWDRAFRNSFVSMQCWKVLSFWFWRTLTRGFQDERCSIQGE